MDEAQKAMIAAAQKMAEEAKEDERRGKMNIGENLKEEIAALKKRTSDRVKKMSGGEGVKDIGLETQFQINEMKKFVSQHREAFQSEITRQIDFYAKEEAKVQLRSDASLAQLQANGFKDLDKKIETVTSEMKDVVKGKIARVETRAFLKSMRTDVLKKLTAFKEEMILNKQKKAEQEAAALKQKQEAEKAKADLAAKKQKVESKTDKKDLVKYAVKEMQQKKDEQSKKRKQKKDKQSKQKKSDNSEPKPMSDKKQATKLQKEINTSKQKAKKSTEAAEAATEKSGTQKKQAKEYRKQAGTTSDAEEKKKLSKKAGDSETSALALEKKAAKDKETAQNHEKAASKSADALKKMNQSTKKAGTSLQYFEKI
jgi:hypothetical protein